jgi:transcriptional regulator with XRE-family HTH domain
MLALAEPTALRLYWHMAQRHEPDRISDRQALGLTIKAFRERAGLTQQEAADRLGSAVPTWQRYEWGARGLPFEKLGSIARVLGVDRQAILEAAGLAADELPATASTRPERRVVLRSPPPTLPVRDRVQAGAWLGVDDFVQTGPKQEPALRDPRYPHADQWLSEVVGDSVDMLRIFDGDLIQCVDVIGAGYHPKTGDVVEAERLRFGGQEREMTVKQVEVLESGRVLLWPRSSNPRWREPLELTAGSGETELEVRVRGLVLRTIRRFA